MRHEPVPNCQERDHRYQICEDNLIHRNRSNRWRQQKHHCRYEKRCGNCGLRVAWFLPELSDISDVSTVWCNIPWKYVIKPESIFSYGWNRFLRLSRSVRGDGVLHGDRVTEWTIFSTRRFRLIKAGRCLLKNRRLPNLRVESANQFGDAIGIVRYHHRMISKCRPDQRIVRRFQLAGVIAIDIIRVLENVTGEHRDNIGVP
jgi:hypothetical protein